MFLLYNRLETTQRKLLPHSSQHLLFRCSATSFFTHVGIKMLWAVVPMVQIFWPYLVIDITQLPWAFLCPHGWRTKWQSSITVRVAHGGEGYWIWPIVWLDLAHGQSRLVNPTLGPTIEELIPVAEILLGELPNLSNHDLIVVCSNHPQASLAHCVPLTPNSW